MNKTKSIGKTTTFKGLKDVVYKVTSIERSPNHEKFIFHCYSEVNPLVIKNDEDVYYFVTKQLNINKKPHY